MALIAPKVQLHAALIDPAEVGQLLRAIDALSRAPLAVTSPLPNYQRKCFLVHRLKSIMLHRTMKACDAHRHC
jgi:hypothetical protein